MAAPTGPNRAAGSRIGRAIASLRIVLLLAATVVLIPLVAAGAGPAWKTYVNVRFQYALSYPAALFVPQPEAPDADGRAFLGRDGARLIVYGSNNVPRHSLRSLLASTAARLTGRGGTVTYQVLRSHWFVVSGRNGPVVFYAKTLYNGAQYKSFELTYPADRGRTYGAIIPHLSRGFRNLTTPPHRPSRSDRDR